MYAARYKVDLDEAVRRLRLQRTIGELNAVLYEEERGTFAGLWIEHEPQFRVVVAMASPQAGKRVLDAVAGTALEGLVQVTRAAFPLERLEAAQAASHHLAHQLGVPVESEIDVRSNRVQLYSLEPERLTRKMVASRLSLPRSVEVVALRRLSSPHTDIYGGLALSTCTSGFSVKNSSGTRGITTAAHCSNSQSYSGSALTFQSADQEGNQDVQWHTAPGFTVTNKFNTGDGGIRDCTATKSRSSQAVGDYVCGYGNTTGYKCGTISSTTYAISYVTNSASTFIRVDDTGGTDLSEGGDSGGPWFIGGTAYGTHSGSPGADENDALYMAINYVSSLGVSVLTAP